MRLNDVLSGLLWVLLGGGVAVYAWTFPAATGAGVGPGLFPLAIGLSLVAGGIVMTASAWKARHESGWVEWDEGLRQPRPALKGALAVGSLGFYAAVVDTVGFFLTSFAMLAGLFLAFGVSRKWIVPIAVGVTLGLHVAFYTLLRVPLPWGWLEGIAW